MQLSFRKKVPVFLLKFCRVSKMKIFSLVMIFKWSIPELGCLTKTVAISLGLFSRLRINSPASSTSMVMAWAWTFAKTWQIIWDMSWKWSLSWALELNLRSHWICMMFRIPVVTECKRKKSNLNLSKDYQRNKEIGLRNLTGLDRLKRRSKA